MNGYSLNDFIIFIIQLFYFAMKQLLKVQMMMALKIFFEVNCLAVDETEQGDFNFLV